MYSIICGSAPFLPMFALISRNAGFNYCLTIFDASLPIRMVLRREILYLTHLIGKYRARLGIFCSDLMEQKREEGKGRRARQIYSKPLLIIDRRHIWSLFASKLDGWKRTPLVTYSFLTRFYLFYISKWIKNLKDLRYINFYHKVLSNKSNTLCNNFRRKIYNSVICYRYINTTTESLYFAYIYSNHLVINHLGLELARILSITLEKARRNLFSFLVLLVLIQINFTAYPKKLSPHLVLPHIFQKELEQTSSSPSIPHNVSLSHQYLYRQSSPSPPNYLSLNLPSTRTWVRNFPSKNSKELWSPRRACLHSIPCSHESRGRESLDCGIRRWPSRCFDHRDPPSVAHITKPVVPLSLPRAYTTTRFIILFIATTRNYCPPDLNPRFRFHRGACLSTYLPTYGRREGPDNRPARGPFTANESSLASNNGKFVATTLRFSMHRIDSSPR